MARRSDHSRDELREMAVNAGQKIIKNEGFSNFSARKVARNIGYTIGTIYNIFESHDDFILHINIVTLREMCGFIAEKTNGTGEEAIKQMVSAYIQFAQNDYNRWSALFEHIMPNDTPLPDWYDEEVKKIFLLVGSYFMSITNDAKAAEMASKTIWASIHGICQLGMTGKLDIIGAQSIQELTDSLIENYLKGVKS